MPSRVDEPPHITALVKELRCGEDDRVVVACAHVRRLAWETTPGEQATLAPAAIAPLVGLLREEDPQQLPAALTAVAALADDALLCVRLQRDNLAEYRLGP